MRRVEGIAEVWGRRVVVIVMHVRLLQVVVHGAPRAGSSVGPVDPAGRAGRDPIPELAAAAHVVADGLAVDQVWPPTLVVSCVVVGVAPDVADVVAGGDVLEGRKNKWMTTDLFVTIDLRFG